MRLYWLRFGGRWRLRSLFSIFMSVIWLSSIIYYMLGQLLHSPRSRIKILSKQRGGTNTSVVEPQILTKLGFVKDPKLFQPSSKNQNHNLPVFALFVDAPEVDDFFTFLTHFQQHFSDKKLLVYNLGIHDKDLAVIVRLCQCEIREVRWEKYPRYARKYKAYRPLIIQESLDDFGMVFWCDTGMKFTSSDIHALLSQAHTHGLVAWPQTPYPTSALTHYNMFRYFRTNHSNYYFHRMAEPDHALYVNTETTHKKLMLPWVRCALEIDCISPQGSQVGGCNYNHRPRYIYTGCHRYDVSAFNVILGQAFNMDTPYLRSDGLFISDDR